MEPLESLTLQVGAEEHYFESTFIGYKATIYVNHTRIWQGGGPQKRYEDAIEYAKHRFSYALGKMLDEAE